MAGSKTANTTQFSTLPLEIRQEIWNLTLPGPRILMIDQKIQGHQRNTHKTNPTSYGGHHPRALSVNRESRAVALRLLTPLLGAYWNLTLDVPYLELRDYVGNEVTQLAGMRAAGELDCFRSIALDWKLWGWMRNNNSMEFQASCRTLIRGYEHPITALNALPNIKSCIVVMTEHTMQEDLLNTGVPWKLGPVTRETYLDDDWGAEEVKARNEIDLRKSEVKRGDEMEFDVLSIHDRSRSSMNAHKPGKAVWDYDWFG